MSKEIENKVFAKVISLKKEFTVVKDRELRYSDANIKITIYRRLENGQPRYSMEITRSNKTNEFVGTVARKCWHGVLKEDAARGRGRPSETYDYSDAQMEKLILDLP